ncbi:MAG: NAD(P)/FAD-dependent oxidoreductase [Gammaproteobacteria bacterium]|jgi:phytoene dehydrogenase-like protein
MAQRSTPEALIIGAGHNGLVCACYLAAAGVRVTLLERRAVVGGAAVTEEFHPGFRNSVASYTVSLLNPRVIADLRLAEHGLRILERPMNNLLPLPDGDAFSAPVEDDALRQEVARFSRRDAGRLGDFQRMLETVADQLRATLLETPPGPGGGFPALLAALRLGRRTHALSAASQRDLHEIFTRSAGEILDDWFESEPIKALYGFDAVVGNYAGPYAPGSAYVLLHHAFGEVNGRRGVWGHAVGGMGAITQAMAAEARDRGVTLLTEAEVSQVRVRHGRACGVVLADGREFDADMVIANVNPRLLYLQMLDAGDLDPEFLGRIRRYRCGSGTLRMNVALSELPRFRCLPGDDIKPGHQSGIVIAPSLDYMEQSWLDARRHGWSRRPVVEMMIPSTMDDSLAPPGQHVASLFCQHFAPELPDGKGWDACAAEAAERVIDTIDEYAPNFRTSIVGRMVLTPADLERQFGLVGGDIFHGALGLDQLFSARPVLGFGAYRGPLRALYMCGSGTHPGGGVTGAPGHNAAHEILRDLKHPGRGHLAR